LESQVLESLSLQTDINSNSDGAKAEEAGKQTPEFSSDEKHIHIDVEPSRPNFSDSEDGGDFAYLGKAFHRSIWVSMVLCTILVIIIPLPLFFSSVVYGKKGFTTWISLVIVWLIIAACGCILYPIWESRDALIEITGGIYKDLRRKPRV
jgi:hypothetical protein